jgi:phosphatidate cytidylyltransferase
MLKQRLFAALILIPTFLAALWFLPQWAWAALMGLIVLQGANEWARLGHFGAVARGLFLTLTAGVLGGCYFLLEHAEFTAWWAGWLSMVFWLILAPLWLGNHWHVARPFARALVGWVVLIPTWIAIVEIRLIGAGLVLFAMGLIWLADSAAYFSGQAWGRRKLAPTISPGKTWEGFFGAMVAVIILATVVAGVSPNALLGGYAIKPWILAPAAAFVVAVSVLGDLFESQIKRLAGVKDSGSLIPGHGGVLDRIDSQTAALPLFLILCLIYLGRHP